MWKHIYLSASKKYFALLDKFSYRYLVARTSFPNPEKYSSNSIIKKNIRAFRKRIISRNPFYSAFALIPQIIYVARNYTQKLCSRRAYERARFISRNLGGNEKK